MSIDVLGDFVYTRTYARWLDDLGRREVWDESVARYFKFLHKFHGSSLSSDEWSWLQNMMRDKKIVGSMRLLWAAGPAAEEHNMTIFNCTFAAVRDLRVFSEALYILMCGSGFGYSVEEQFISQLPRIRKQKNIPKEKIVVEDSKIGWAQALHFCLETFYDGRDVEVDYSGVRPRGSRLLTMGGRASGPEPLQRLIDYARTVILSRQGTRLTPYQAHSLMCMIAEIVVVGGVRRSSLISLSDLDDQQMRDCKRGEFWNHSPHLRMANNSAVYDVQPSNVALMNEWISLINSQSGERGIFVRHNALTTAPRRKKHPAFGTNPCQPSYATVLTPSGISTIGEIKPGDIIWSGTRWTAVQAKWSTGVKAVYRYRTTTGSFVGTDNHRVVSNGEKVEVKDAETIDYSVGAPMEPCALDPQDIMDGLVLGDGSVHKASNNLVYLYIGEKDGDYFSSEISSLILKARPGLTEEAYEIQTTITASELPKTFQRSVPDRFFFGDAKKKAGFLRGLFTANGSINGNRVCLKQTSRALAAEVQEMLSSLGIPSFITTNKPSEIKFSNGTYTCKESYDINITAGRSVFRDCIGFIQAYKQEKIEPSSKPRYLTSAVKSVEFLEETEVFDINVDCDSHTYWTGGCLVSNCGEIVLRDQEMCNLSEAIARANDDPVSLSEKIRAATILGTLQSSFTDFKFLRPEWKRNADEERLLGVSITGIMDCPAIRDKDVLRELKRVAVETNAEFADRLEINHSAAITTVKPSGTVSQTLDCSSGIHTRWAKYYIRRIRISASDPLYQFASISGIPAFPEIGEDVKHPTTWVLEFPVAAPDDAITRHDLDALGQLEMWKLFKENYTEHNVSMTVYVDETEWIDVLKWLNDNWKIVGGISFLPKTHHVYTLAPYEEISREEYERRLAAFPALDYSLLSTLETDDQTTGAKEYACVSGQCEI